MKRKVSKATKTITIDNLAEIVTKGLVEAEKRTDKKIDDLATMVANGFSHLENKLTGKIDGLGNRMGNLENRMDSFDVKLDGINNRIDDIALNRTTREEHRILEARVVRIEKKLSL